MITILDDIATLFKLFMITVNPPVTSTLNLFEAIALALAVIGFFLVYQGISHAMRRKRDLIESGKNGILMLIANENIRVEKERLNKMIFVLVAALVAASVPSRPSPQYGWAGSIISLAFMGIIFYLVKGSYGGMLYRRSLDTELEKLNQEAELSAITRNRRIGDGGN